MPLCGILICEIKNKSELISPKERDEIGKLGNGGTVFARHSEEKVFFPC